MNAEHGRGEREAEPEPEPVLVAWSGGKDSALALHRLMQDAEGAGAAAAPRGNSPSVSVAESNRHPAVSTDSVWISRAVGLADPSDPGAPAVSRSIGAAGDPTAAAEPRAYAPIGLLTTMTEPGDRVASHRVRRSLVEAQAAALGLPLVPVLLPPDPANGVYEERLAAALAPFQARGLRRVVFGDLFLADLRAYRERHLASLGFSALFPLWGEDTAALARRFLALGFAATVVAVDTEVLPSSMAGRPYDQAFLDALPAGVDPCGENGEFHTFVHAGPLFRAPIPTLPAPPQTQGRFTYSDLQPQRE